MKKKKSVDSNIGMTEIIELLSYDFKELITKKYA